MLCHVSLQPRLRWLGLCRILSLVTGKGRGSSWVNEPVPALRKERWLGFSTGTNENYFWNLGCSSEGTCGRVQGKWNKEEDSCGCSFSLAASLQDKQTSLGSTCTGNKESGSVRSLAAGSFLVSVGCDFHTEPVNFSFLGITTGVSRPQPFCGYSRERLS